MEGLNNSPERKVEMFENIKPLEEVSLLPEEKVLKRINDQMGLAKATAIHDAYPTEESVRLALGTLANETGVEAFLAALTAEGRYRPATIKELMSLYESRQEAASASTKRGELRDFTEYPPLRELERTQSIGGTMEVQDTTKPANPVTEKWLFIADSFWDFSPGGASVVDILRKDRKILLAEIVK